jgi:glutamate-1-semialdehyde 2,1-aminomutase
VERHFSVEGRDCNLIFVTKDRDGQRSQPFRTLFMQELIHRGIIGPSFVISYSHTEDDVDRTIEAADAALEIYARALTDGVEAYLEGPSVKPVFRPRA